MLLINPPMPYEIKGHLQTPLGLCYLSSMIKSIAESLVFDCNVSGDIETTIHQFKPDVIGISVLTATYINVLKLLCAVSQLAKPNCIFIAGGVHASIFPEELLKNGFHLVIRGEGERVFFGVISSIAKAKDYYDLAGISFVGEDGVIKHNPDAELIEDLDTIPLPDRKDLPLHNYEHEAILTSRGCNFRCFYCSSSHYWGHKTRYRSAENVFAELWQLYITGVRKFYFCDDNFTSSHALVKGICQGIIFESMNIRWSALTRADTVDIDLLKLMKQAGCTILSFGIESGLNAFHKNTKKTSIEKIMATFAMLREIGIKTRTTWIIGLGKTVEDEYNSLQFIKELLPDQVSVHCLIPFPNTEAWYKPEKYNLVLDKENFDWNVMNMTYSPYLLDNIRFKHITKEEIISLIEKTRKELKDYKYDGVQRKFETFLDNEIIKVIE